MTIVINEPQSRRARKKAAARGRIVEAGIRLFAAHGIDAVTVDQIAAEADVAKGTIYNHFETKEDIVVAFMVDLEGKVQARLRDFATANRSVAATLVDFVQTQFRLKQRHHAFVRVFLGHMFVHTEQFLPYMAEMQKVIDPPLEALFGALQRRGRIRADVDLAELVLVFKTIQLGLTALWAVEGPPFKGVTRVMERELTLFCQGLEVTRS
jgi:TetR/AcrR family transcriptional regulator of autoinduction and epiphytic fitness